MPDVLGDEARGLLIMRSRNSGFTLIELAVTMTVLALLAMLAVPNLSAWMQSSRVRTTAEYIQDGLRQAQAEAVKENRTVAFILTTSQPSSTTFPAPVAASTSASYWYAATVPWTSAALTSGNSTIGTITTSSNTMNLVAMGITSSDASQVSVQTTVPTVCFSPFGRLTSTYVDPTGVVTCGAAGATVSYAVAPTTAVTGSQALRVTVSPGGQIRMCNPAKSLPTPDGC